MMLIFSYILMIVFACRFVFFFFFFKQKTAYEMRISDWSSDVCSSDLLSPGQPGGRTTEIAPGSGLQPYHIPAKGCIPGIYSKNFFFAILQFQPKREHQFNAFLI